MTTTQLQKSFFSGQLRVYDPLELKRREADRKPLASKDAKDLDFKIAVKQKYLYKS